MSESSTAPQNNNWWQEPWACRGVTEPRLAAYVCGRCVNCFEFHAQQSFVLSLTSAKSSRWEPHGKAAQAALKKLANLVSFLNLSGDAEQSPERESLWIKSNLERLHDDWRDDPVGETDTLRADDYLWSPDDPFPDRLSAWRAFLETTGQIRLDQEWRDLYANIPEDSRDAMQLGRCLDSILRPSAVFLSQLRYDSPTSIPATGKSCSEDYEAVTHSVQLSKLHSVRSLAAGEAEPDGSWQVHLDHALKKAGISLPRALEKTLMGAVVQDRVEYVTRLGAFIWAQFDSSLPRWDETSRRLFYRGKEIKDFSQVDKSNDAKRATQLDIIRQFHELGWPSEIDTSCFGYVGDDPADYFKGVDNLNVVRTRQNKRRLPISFRLTNNGKVIEWGPYSKSSEDT